MAADELDFEDPALTLRLLDELEAPPHRMEDRWFKPLHHLPTAERRGHRRYCNAHVQHGRRFRRPGNPETAERLDAALRQLRRGRSWQECVSHARLEVPGAIRLSELRGDGFARSTNRQLAWDEMLELELLGLGVAEGRELRDVFHLATGLPGVALLTDTPGTKGGFIRVEDEEKRHGILFRHATPALAAALPSLHRKDRWLEFALRPLTAEAIKLLFRPLREILQAPEFEPTDDPAELEAARAVLARRPLSPVPPKGQREPERITTAWGVRFKRKPAILDWVTRAANGHCEACGEPAPFLRADGTPYLELHHVRRLADAGSDTVENAVAVCPNCHRRLHHSADAGQLVTRLYATVPRLRIE